MDQATPSSPVVQDAVKEQPEPTNTTQTQSISVRDQIRKDQAEKTRELFQKIATSDNISNEVLRSFAATLSNIIKHWQERSGDKNPTNYAIEFGPGKVTATLSQVLALLPENYQFLNRVKDESDAPAGGRSWLDGNLMDALVELQLPVDSRTSSSKFGRGLASNISTSLDDIFEMEFNKSYLEHYVSLMKEGKDRSDWNPEEVFTVPRDTRRIVYFWNYSENHWTVACIDIDNKSWSHTFYNSLEYDGFPSKSAIKRAPFIEELIQGASGFDCPENSYHLIGPSAPQDNLYDCGVISVYNAVELLLWRRPSVEVNATKLRLDYLTLIFSSLEPTVELENDNRTSLFNSFQCTSPTQHSTGPTIPSMVKGKSLEKPTALPRLLSQPAPFWANIPVQSLQDMRNYMETYYRYQRDAKHEGKRIPPITGDMLYTYVHKDRAVHFGRMSRQSYQELCQKSWERESEERRSAFFNIAARGRRDALEWTLVNTNGRTSVENSSSSCSTSPPTLASPPINTTFPASSAEDDWIVVGD